MPTKEQYQKYKEYYKEYREKNKEHRISKEYKNKKNISKLMLVKNHIQLVIGNKRINSR
jgi:hypothetical protein